MPINKEALTKNKRLLWLLIIIILLLIIAVVIYLIFFQLKPVVPVVVNQNLNQAAPLPLVNQPTVFNNTNSQVLADVQGVSPAPEVAGGEKQSVTFIATSFAERYGTYSNQSGFRNFDELAPFMTDSMAKYVASYKQQLMAQYSDINIYYALVTKAISIQINNMDESSGTGEILVKNQRQEFKNTLANPRIFYQDILLKMLKVNNEWKVNGAYWQ